MRLTAFKAWGSRRNGGIENVGEFHCCVNREAALSTLVFGLIDNTRHDVTFRHM
jgi:hypothetical protein